MAQLWGGRFTKETDQLVYNFNASISFDQKFYEQDIRGSIAHVTMLAEQGILTEEEKEQILAALNINDIEDADAEYSKYIVAEHIIKKDSIDKVSGFNVVDANISNENLPLYVANINKTIKYVIPIVRNGVCNGYISLNEDGKTLFGVYMPELNEESTTVEEAKEAVEETK